MTYEYTGPDGVRYSYGADPPPVAKEPPMKHKLIDIASRAGWTAAQAFLAVFAVTDVSTLSAALVAASGAALSVIKTTVAQKVESRMNT